MRLSASRDRERQRLFAPQQLRHGELLRVRRLRGKRDHRRRWLLLDRNGRGMGVVYRCRAERFLFARLLRTKRAQPQRTPRQHERRKEVSTIEIPSFAVLYAELILAWLLAVFTSSSTYPDFPIYLPY